jgi:hypothetical protein
MRQVFEDQTPEEKWPIWQAFPAVTHHINGTFAADLAPR